MKKQSILLRPASAQGAVATGARATGSSAIGSVALGAMALGATAIGALAIGRLAIGRARLGRVDIGELVIGKLTIGGETPESLTIVTHIRAAVGKGDAMERLLLDPAQVAGSATDILRRSASDPDLFVHEHHVGPSGLGDSHGQWLVALRSRITADGLIEGTIDDAITVDRLQSVAHPPKINGPVLAG